MIVRYAYALHERATREIIAAEAFERNELLKFFEKLARDPGCRGTEQVIDENGRTNEVAYTDHFRVVYWSDHSVREVRIVDIRGY